MVLFFESARFAVSTIPIILKWMLDIEISLLNVLRYLFSLWTINELKLK